MSDEFKKEAAISYLTSEIARLFRRRFEDEARVHGLTLPQWRVLSELHRQDGISQVALAATVDTEPMTLSGILDRLEKRGIISRFSDPSDSRAKLARLTSEGRELFTTTKAMGRELYADAIKGLSPEELGVIATGLSRIRDNLNHMTAEQKESA